MGLELGEGTRRPRLGYTTSESAGHFVMHPLTPRRLGQPGTPFVFVFMWCFSVNGGRFFDVKVFWFGFSE